MKNNENEKAANSGKKPKYVKKIITETILKGSITNFVGFPIPLVALSAHIE